MAVKKKGSGATRSATTNKSGSSTDALLAAKMASTNIRSQPTIAQLSSGEDDMSLGYSSLELQAMLENFELDAASKLAALRKNQLLRLQAMQRHWQTAVNSLDPHIRDMSLARFLTDFDGDKDAALRGVVATQLRRQQGPMSQVEQSARKRKRPDLKSPTTIATIGEVGEGVTGDADVFGAPIGSLSKKARMPAASSKAKPSSASRAKAAQQGSGSPAAGTARKSRLRLRPSTIAASTAESGSSTGNFVYRAGLNPLLPATPSVKTGAGGTRARQPRRGESIVLQSVNGSPLGEFVASDLEDDDEEDREGDENAAEDDWDMMDKNEASRAEEDVGKGKGKGRTGKGKKAPTNKTAASSTKNAAGQAKATRKSSRSRSSSLSNSTTGAAGISAPSAPSFAVALPADAPSYDELKERVIAGMRADLAKRVMGDEERKVLVASLEAFASGAI